MRHCFFCQKNIKEIDYTNTNLLKKYLTPLGRINSPRRTGACAKHQRQVAKAIKRARNMGLLPYSKR